MAQFAESASTMAGIGLFSRWNERRDIHSPLTTSAVPADLEHCARSYADAWRRNPTTGPIGCDTREASDGVLPRSLGLRRGVRLVIEAGAATGRVNNGGAAFTELERNEAGEAIIASHGDDWGRGPFEVEGVPAEITLPSPASRTNCWALDGRGCRQREVPVSADADGRAVIVIGPDCRTVWYEIAVSPK